MEYKRLGNTRERLSAIGIGTWQLSKDIKENEKAINLAIEKGVNLIDTAEIYGTENTVGRIIKGKRLFIATKVWATHFRYDQVLKACERSLKNLDVKSIDLYQLHWPNPRINIKETMKAMEKLVYDGKIRYIGVSNFNEMELRNAQEAMSKYEIVSNQVEYNLIERMPEINLIDYMKKEKITLLAYSPFAHGKIFKKKYKDIIERVGEIGKKYNKTAEQVLLRWLIQKDIVIPLTKASNPNHMQENIAAADFKINQKDMKFIDSLTPKNSNAGLSRFKNFIAYYLILRDLLRL
ncbi:MAG: aldo/keto reductase [Candidatus Parvarchaeum sp.]